MATRQLNEYKLYYYILIYFIPTLERMNSAYTGSMMCTNNGNSRSFFFPLLIYKTKQVTRLFYFKEQIGICTQYLSLPII